MSMIELEKGKLPEIYEILDKIRLNKILDSNIRKNILKLILRLPKEISLVKDDIKQMTLKYFNEFNEEDKNNFQKALFDVNLLIQNKNFEGAKQKDSETSDKYPELTKAYISLNNDIRELQKEKISLNIEKMNLDAFVDSMVGQPINISIEELNILNPLLNNDFNDENENC